MQDIKGVQFVTDSVGHKVAVQLDLEQWAIFGKIFTIQ
jgi:hypothetical protein